MIFLHHLVVAHYVDILAFKKREKELLECIAAEAAVEGEEIEGSSNISSSAAQEAAEYCKLLMNSPSHDYKVLHHLHEDSDTRYVELSQKQLLCFLYVA